jgi:hypothetical protein
MLPDRKHAWFRAVLFVTTFCAGIPSAGARDPAPVHTPRHVWTAGMRKELSRGEIVSMKKNARQGQNTSYVATIRMSNGKTVRAIAKQSGWAGPFAEAASRIDDVLGPKFDFVPPTTTRSVDGKTWTVPGAQLAR